MSRSWMGTLIGGVALALALSGAGVAQAGQVPSGQAPSGQAGDVTAAANPATWSPPSNLVTPLNQVWSHQESTYGNLYGFRNYGWDQVFVNGGYLNFCVRWDSSAPVSASLR